MSKNILIKSVSSGVGLLIAKELHRKGLSVLITLQHVHVAYDMSEKQCLSN